MVTYWSIRRTGATTIFFLNLILRDKISLPHFILEKKSTLFAYIRVRNYVGVFENIDFSQNGSYLKKVTFYLKLS